MDTDRETLERRLRRQQKELENLLEAKDAYQNDSIPANVIAAQISALQDAIASNRSLLAQANGETEGGFPAMSEFRLNSLEITLREMNSEIKRLADSYHELDKRQFVTDQRLAQIALDVEALRGQIRTMAAPSAIDIPRPILIMGAVAVVGALVFMLFITWRLLQWP